MRDLDSTQLSLPGEVHERQQLELALLGETDLRSKEQEEEAKHLPEGWLLKVAPTGQTYYLNTLTKDFSWERPTRHAEEDVVLRPFNPNELPSGWQARKSETGQTFYFNTYSQQSQWEVPRFPADMLPQGWEKKLSRDGQPYFVNTHTGQAQWEWPLVPAHVQQSMSLDPQKKLGLSKYLQKEKARAAQRKAYVNPKAKAQAKRKPVAEVKARQAALRDGTVEE